MREASCWKLAPDFCRVDGYAHSANNRADKRLCICPGDVESDGAGLGERETGHEANDADFANHCCDSSKISEVSVGKPQINDSREKEVNKGVSYEEQRNVCKEMLAHEKLSASIPI